MSNIRKSIQTDIFQECLHDITTIFIAELHHSSSCVGQMQHSDSTFRWTTLQSRNFINRRSFYPVHVFSHVLKEYENTEKLLSGKAFCNATQPTFLSSVVDLVPISFVPLRPSSTKTHRKAISTAFATTATATTFCAHLPKTTLSSLRPLPCFPTAVRTLMPIAIDKRHYGFSLCERKQRHNVLICGIRHFIETKRDAHWLDRSYMWTFLRRNGSWGGSFRWVQHKGKEIFVSYEPEINLSTKQIGIEI